MNEEVNLRRAIDARLSALRLTSSMQADILRSAHAKASPRIHRKLSVSLAFALLALLLTASAYAAVRFGVLAFHADQAQNDTYLKHIQEIDERVESPYASITVSDAVFDGMSLSLALDIEHVPGAPSVYLYPYITVQTGGQPVPAQVHGFQAEAKDYSLGASSMGTDASTGIWMPLRGGAGETLGHFNFDAALLADETSALPYGVATEPVTWTLTLYVLRPTLPVKETTLEEYGTPDAGGSYSASMEDYAALASQALEQGILLTADDGDLSFFGYNQPAPAGIDPARWQAMNTDERLIAAGALECVDQITATFTTEAPDVFVLSEPTTFSLGEDTCTITSLAATFARLDFALQVRSANADKPAAEALASGEGHWEFVVRTTPGEALCNGTSMGADDDGSVYHYAAYTLTQPAESLTFIPVYVREDEFFWSDTYTPTEEDMQHAFTIPLS